MYKSIYPVTYYFYPLLQERSQDENPAELVYQHFLEPATAYTSALLYLHIPYCHDVCRFCPFHIKVDNDEQTYRRYTEVICQEIRTVGALPRTQSLRFRAVYFGGGSPSVLPPDCIDEIFQTISQCVDLDDDVEISFEGEPRTLGDPFRLEILKKWKTGRISFGLQTYDAALRELFNISATLDDVEVARKRGREFSFEEINVDMMYGLPGQTLGQLDRELSRLLEDDYDSIDYYCLHYFAFPKKMLEKMNSGKMASKPTDPIFMALSEQVRVRMMSAGYRNVADQVYTKKSKVCEYFRLLWGGGYGEHRAETVAVGSSARGYVNGRVYMNHGNVQKYIDGVTMGRLPVEKVSTVLDKPENRGAVFFSKFFRLDKAYESAVRSIEPQIFKQWIDEGYVYEAGDSWMVSERGKGWINNLTYDAFCRSQRDLGETAIVNLPKKAGIRTGSF